MRASARGRSASRRSPPSRTTRDALAGLVNHPKLRDVPFYLEAPDATLKEYGEAIGKFQKARASA